MKTGILFLLLQSTLLYSTVSLEPGIAVNSLPEVANSVLIACGGGDQTDDDNGSVSAADFSLPAYRKNTDDFSPLPATPLKPRRESHGIRAPPLTA